MVDEAVNRAVAAEGRRHGVNPEPHVVGMAAEQAVRDIEDVEVKVRAVERLRRYLLVKRGLAECASIRAWVSRTLLTWLLFTGVRHCLAAVRELLHRPDVPWYNWAPWLWPTIAFDEVRTAIMCGGAAAFGAYRRGCHDAYDYGPAVDGVLTIGQWVSGVACGVAMLVLLAYSRRHVAAWLLRRQYDWLADLVANVGDA